jgi:spore coat polysaccharide biosynthesis protein SpsF
VAIFLQETGDEYMKVVAIIQARMGSTRLPGKVIRELAGKPMIIHLIERLKTCCTVDEIILATGEGDENTVLVSTAEQAGITAFAGPEEDVLARFCMAAQKAGADHVIRVTGDNPLTDPECIDRLVQKQVETGADYGCMTGLPLGTTAEIISFRALEKSCREGKQQPHREHVTVYAKENPQKFKLFSLEAPESLRAPELRLTVDTPEDFSLIGEVFKRLCKDGQIISLAEVINLLRTEPELAARNKGIVQKKPRDRTLIIRADGGIQTGMGHISRTLTLARAIAAEKPVNTARSRKSWIY